MRKVIVILSVFALFASGCRQATNRQAQFEQEKQLEENISNTSALLKVFKINDVSQLPKGITCKGEFKDGIRYFDKLGEHITIITETGSYNNEQNKQGNSGIDAELSAYNFAVNEDNTIKQIWRVYDFYKDCPVDIAANFVENIFQVTDLNDDGIAEIWLMYIIGCKGDISPWNMKIIMYEGNQKFAMRGEEKVIAAGEVYGGEYKFDNAFNNGVKVFRDFAQKLWEENSIVNYDE